MIALDIFHLSVNNNTNKNNFFLQIKCHQYWPSYGTANYGNFQVTLKEVENIADYAIRTFQLQSVREKERQREGKGKRE